MSDNHLKWGDYNAICDVCGFKFKASKMRQRWDGLMVCSQDYEMRHPQDFLRVAPDTPAVPWTRPEGEDVFTYICYIWGRSAYADLGEADCMQADNNRLSYRELFHLKYNSYPEQYYLYSAIPSYAIPGFAIPGTEGMTYGIY